MTTSASNYTAASQRLVQDALLSACATTQHYALVDFPDHSNVGDSAIYLGEMKLLRDLYQRGPSFVSKSKTHVDDIDRFGEIDVIFLHGGGNFGDVWPKHQLFREHILSRYPDKKIVQLPQTLHFSSPEAQNRSAMAFNAHPDVTVMVRDKRSYDLAQEMFTGRVILSPDCALALGPQHRETPATQPYLAMLREDKESQLPQDEGTLFASYPVDDWLTEPRFKSLGARLRDKTLPFWGPLRPFGMTALLHIYESWAHTRVKRGLTQLSSAEFIVTDRLHVHILSSLLNIPHVVLDNNYGKISGYIAQWGLPENATLASSVDELQQICTTRALPRLSQAS